MVLALVRHYLRVLLVASHLWRHLVWPLLRRKEFVLPVLASVDVRVGQPLAGLTVVPLAAALIVAIRALVLLEVARTLLKQLVRKVGPSFGLAFLVAVVSPTY